MTKDEQIIETLKLINFTNFSLEENHPVICKHYQNLNWDATKTIYDIADIKLHIWCAILNYLYSGIWGEYTALTNLSRKAFGMAILKEKMKNKRLIALTEINLEKERKDLINFLSSTWNQVFKAHETYFNILLRFTRRYKTEIKNIIIYEAPPFPKKGNINYILIEEPKPKGPYFTSIYNALKKGDSIQNKLISNNVLFFDLLMLPIPLSSAIRRDWSTINKFKINGKQLPVVLFEMNLVHFLNKLNEEGVNLSPNIKIAIGTPHLTALGIYNHFCKKSYKIEVGYQNIITSLIECNTKENKKYLKNYVVPLFKSSFVNASNNPDQNLLKHALTR
ncbi:MAG: hypothetical protein RLZZ198_608 [Bacteroidota bacterium]|jgi:hypothetical protein